MEAFFYLITVVGTLSAIVGALGASTVYELKGILAYSSISQMGYILVSLAPYEPVLATVAFSYHYLAHAYAKALLFLSAGTLIYALNSRDVKGSAWVDG